MTLLEAFKMRHRVKYVMQVQDPAYLTPALKEFRMMRLKQLDSIISKYLGYGDKNSKTEEWSLSLDRKGYGPGIGDSARTLGTVKQFKATTDAKHGLCRWSIKAKILAVCAFIVFPFVVIIEVRKDFIAFEKSIKEVNKVIPNPRA